MTKTRWLVHILILVVLAGSWHCARQNDSEQHTNNVAYEAGGEAVIVFDTLFHDFGTMIEGEQVVCYFSYENTGMADLLIESVEATCGCTVPDWDPEPLRPGGEGLLGVRFDSKGRLGSQRKRVTVRSNAKTQVLHLTLAANIRENNNY